MSIDTKYQTNVYFLHSSTSCSGLFHTALTPVWSLLINNFTHKAKVLSDWTWTCSHTDDFLQSAKTPINLAVQICFLLPPLTSLNKFSLSNYTHAGICNTENNNAALQACLIKPQPIVHAVYVSAHEFLWLRIWSCVWVLERRRLVPAGSGAPCATQPVCSHNTHFIIGLRGARRSARRLRIMLIYGIYCHRSIPITYLALL